MFLILFFYNIFTSKVLGADGIGGFESYPTSEIPTKDIYDAFLMIYLCILLLLFFVTFWHFTEVNRTFTKAVIL